MKIRSGDLELLNADRHGEVNRRIFTTFLRKRAKNDPSKCRLHLWLKGHGPNITYAVCPLVAFRPRILQASRRWKKAIYKNVTFLGSCATESTPPIENLCRMSTWNILQHIQPFSIKNVAGVTSHPLVPSTSGIRNSKRVRVRPMLLLSQDKIPTE
jgi:hypothetical protein